MKSVAQNYLCVKMEVKGISKFKYHSNSPTTIGLAMS